MLSLSKETMKQNTHKLMQLIKTTMPDVYQTPMPQVSKQVLNVCPRPHM